MSELKESIEKLYSVFSRYPLADVVEGCSCCVDVKDHLALRAAPLRVLPVVSLTHYAECAITTWGTEEDFKHFLPRILELLSQERDLKYDTEIIVGKLRYAGWLNWQDNEKVAIKNYLMSVWKELLIRDTFPIEASDWVCSVGIIGEDLEPYLRMWLEAKSKVAYGRLLKAVKNGWILNNAFWDEKTEGKRQVIAWLESKDTSYRLIDIYFENEEADFAKPLGECIDVLSAFQKE